MKQVPTCIEIESLIAKKWGIRQNIIIPNVSWGFDIHECDLLIVSQSNYCTEIEIKVSKSDLKKDLTKKHKHRSNKIKYLFFAIPEKLESCIDYIPPHAGIIIIRKTKHLPIPYQNHFYIDTIRKPKRNELSKQLTPSELAILTRLGCMRIWSLKQIIINLSHNKK